MKFCIECQLLLTPYTTEGDLVFKCKCGKIYPSDPDDSLRYEEILDVSKSTDKYKIFIDNSAFDPTGNKVLIPCKECNMPYLTLIYIGEQETAMYTCTCGKKYSYNELLK